MENNKDNPSALKLASFDESLGLPEGIPEDLALAARAIRQEFRDCSRWKKLLCTKVSVVAESDRGIVHVVHVDGMVDFDWTWEGATAFRPRNETGLIDTREYSDPENVEESACWSGEVLEVDEQNGCLFVSLDNPEVTPVPGEFCVRPFEFLAALNSIYNDEAWAMAREELPRRLAASCGHIHPSVRKPSPDALPELESWWQHSWSVLWGPPGTGKTYTTGKQVAAVLRDPGERILVVSTTNQATDSVAASIGSAARESPDGKTLLEQGRLLRIGKGAAWRSYRDQSLVEMLRGTESGLLARIDRLSSSLSAAESGEDRAVIRMHIQELRDACTDRSKQFFLDSDVRVVVATAFKALTLMRDEMLVAMLNGYRAPFTTIVIDEAGLISRAAVAALSLLSSHRVVLVGDPKQLAPISRIARVLPSGQAKWLASSGLNHLQHQEQQHKAVHVLSRQYRMHRDVCQIVSDFQYQGQLETAAEVDRRKQKLPENFAGFGRAIWYLLDEDDFDTDRIRSSRGPAGKSWIRAATFEVLQKLFEDDSFKSANGLFISPFRSQAHTVASLLAQWKARSWEASTVHSQQGSESDIVIFDTVNAGNVTWPVEEWQRLVNVAISRAREAVILIATREEMQEPHLRSLLKSLNAGILVRENGKFQWRGVDVEGGEYRPKKAKVAESKSNYQTNDSSDQRKATSSKTYRLKQAKPVDHAAEFSADDESDGKWKPKHSLGEQFRSRRTMKPILSSEQQRLSELSLDGRPRLIRGVAGSGKSIVLANWVARTVERLGNSLDPDSRIWAVYANRSLHKLLQNSIEGAWDRRQANTLFANRTFPWSNVSLLHAKDILEAVLPEVGLKLGEFEFNYDVAAEAYLARKGSKPIEARCMALFIDEAQDMGPSMLRLLLSLVEQSSRQDHNSRAAHIFYDNAQNLYGVPTPKWSEFGLDMRGRSSIMRESFRSTRPIIEFAVNVLDHLSETEEHRELLDLGLLKEVNRGDEPWLEVAFNQVSGPRPLFQSFVSLDEQLRTMGDHLIHLIANEDVSPRDICLLYNGPHVANLVMEVLKPRLAPLDVDLSHQTGQAFQRRDNTMLLSTANSFKGFEAEVIFIPCADQFVGRERVLAKSLYVAMTRARSILAVYSQDAEYWGQRKSGFSFSRSNRLIAEVLQSCHDGIAKRD